MNPPGGPPMGGYPGLPSIPKPKPPPRIPPTTPPPPLRAEHVPPLEAVVATGGKLKQTAPPIAEELEPFDAGAQRALACFSKKAFMKDTRKNPPTGFLHDAEVAALAELPFHDVDDEGGAAGRGLEEAGGDDEGGAAGRGLEEADVAADDEGGAAGRGLEEAGDAGGEIDVADLREMPFFGVLDIVDV